MENNEILSEENISKQIRKTIEKGFEITFDKILDKIADDMKKSSKRIIDNSLEDFTIKNINCNEFKKRFRSQIEIEFTNVMFETTNEFFENEDGEIKKKKVKIEQSEVEVSKESNSIFISPNEITLESFWRMEKDINKCINQMNFDILTDLILDTLFDSIKDYKKVFSCLRIPIELSRTNEKYNTSLVVSKILIELSNKFFSLNIPYIMIKTFNMNFGGTVSLRLSEYVIEKHRVEDSAHGNLIRILRVVAHHILRGGSLNFSSNKIELFERYPFLKSLFIEPYYK